MTRQTVRMKFIMFTTILIDFEIKDILGFFSALSHALRASNLEENFFGTLQKRVFFILINYHQLFSYIFSSRFME